MCLRCANKINTTKNSAGMCLCITDVIFDILAEIIIIIAEIVILYNMNDKDDNYYYDYGYRTSRRNSRYSDREWAAAVISTTGAEIFIALHCYCVSFLLKLISAKTDLSYLNYMETHDNSNNIFSRTVNVFSTTENNGVNGNQLNFLGYDKDGHPIYSGNTQYGVISTVSNPAQTVNVIAPK
jgi:hypothetical protein